MIIGKPLYMQVNRYVKSIDMTITTPCYLFAYGMLMTPSGFSLLTGVNKPSDQFTPGILQGHKRGAIAGNGEHAYYGLEQDRNSSVMGVLIHIVSWDMLKHILTEECTHGFVSKGDIPMYQIRDVSRFVTFPDLDKDKPIYTLHTISKDIAKICQLPVFYYQGIYGDLIEEYGPVFAAQFMNSGGMSTAFAIEAATKRKEILKTIEMESEQLY